MAHWKPFSIGKSNYLIKYVTVTNGTIQCYMSDLKKLWKEVVSLNDVKARVKEENPLIDGCEGLDVNNLILKPSKDAVIIDVIADGSKKLTFKYSISEHIRVSFQFYWRVKECLHDEFLEQVTSNILYSLVVQQEQVNELKTIVRQKDDEICQYKFDGAVLVIKHYETKPFDENDFDDRFSNPQHTNEFDEVLKSAEDKKTVLAMCGVEYDLKMFGTPKRTKGIAGGENSPVQGEPSSSTKESPGQKRRVESYLSRKNKQPTKLSYEEPECSQESSENLAQSSDLSIGVPSMKKQKRMKIRKDLSF